MTQTQKKCPEDIKIGIENFYSVFKGEQHTRNALFIWLDAITQQLKNPKFIHRKEHLKKQLNIGNDQFNKSIRFLKKMGLVETYPMRDKKGRMIGSRYEFFNFANRIMNPAVSSSPGPQRNTKAMKRERMEKRGAIIPTRMVRKRGITDSLIFRSSENRINYIKDKEAPLNIKRFDNTDPEIHMRFFLDLFEGQQTFQVFDDSSKKRKYLSKIYHKYDDLNIQALNSQGAGVFLAINETDGKGRATENIIKVRAVFADLDGVPLEPVFEYEPSLIVESSPGKYHVYWLTNDTPLDAFKPLQQAIAERFGADPKVKDLPRVMRVPGFCHHKNEPFMTKILYTNEKTNFSYEELYKLFLDPFKQPGKFPEINDKIRIYGAAKGNRNSELCRLIGAMKKRDYSSKEIKTDAHLFGERCIPPMEKKEIRAVLKSSEGWKN